jgi:hypothetical protein
MNCEPAAIVSSARCFSCIPREMQLAVKLWLLCQWVSAEFSKSPALNLDFDPGNIPPTTLSWTWAERPPNAWLLQSSAAADGPWSDWGKVPGAAGSSGVASFPYWRIVGISTFGLPVTGYSNVVS